MISISELKKVINPEVLQLAKPDFTVEYLISDSRKVNFAHTALFFAIKGQRQDGHTYIQNLYEQGVRNFIVEDRINFNNFKDANIFKVAHSLTAMQQIAENKRIKYDNLDILGITGSNAKTIIKEWIAQMLMPEYLVVKNPKSYNSQIGVPLSVWQINENHTFGVFEAGISKQNEMQNLQNIIKPTYGIFTNIGSAHNEGFLDLKQKIEEKSKLFLQCKKVIYCNDHSEINEHLIHLNLPRFTWSQTGKVADINFNLEKITEDEIQISIILNFKNSLQIFDFYIPFHDTASIENVYHCIAFLLFYGFSIESIQQKVRFLKPVSMRLELKQAIHSSYIIDDSYNNDLAGLTMALDFLTNQNQKQLKTVVLSDVLETGMNSDVLYMLLSETLKEKNITKLIGIGSHFFEHSHYFNTISKTSFFKTTEDFLESSAITDFENEIILVKGARVFEFEKIVKKLEQKSHRTVFEINLDALSNNLNYYRNKLDAKTKIMVMVKSFAYGAGSLEVANLLQFHRVDYLCVAYIDEGVALRKAGILLPIMVLNISTDDFYILTQFKLEPVVYSIKILEELVEYLKSKNLLMSVHLELETGMNRLGIAENELNEVVTIILKSDKLSISSVFSHLAGADEAHFEDYTQTQFGKLLKSCVILENKLKYKFLKHILNSAGIVRYPEMQLDMVRLGIGLYGVEANGLEQKYLQNVGTLKTIITQIKKVRKGESIGYSRKGVALDDLTIGIMAIGYGDGYSRGFSNGVGKVLVNNVLVPVIGNVCMDMTMIDLSKVKAKEGDEVIVFGKNIDINEMAKSIQTIPYEIFTSVSERVKRVFYTE